MGDPAWVRCQPTSIEGRSSVSAEQRENLEVDEANAALDRAGQLLSAHLADAERVTA